MTVHDRIERATGILFGTYRWSRDTPPPRFAVILRHPDDDFVRFEAIAGGRGFYAMSAAANAMATGPLGGDRGTAL